MKSKKQAVSKKGLDEEADDLLANIPEAAEGEAEVSDDMPIDLAELVGEDALELTDDLLAVEPAKAEDDVPLTGGMSMTEFGVEAEEAVDPLSSEEKRYFMGEDEDSEDDEQTMIDDSFVPEDYES